VAVFVTCYGRYNHPQMVEDLVAVYRHNGIAVKLIRHNQCCGMPKMELGDLDSVDRYKQANLPVLATAVREGWDIVTPIPSCTLMLRRELALMFPDDPVVQAAKPAWFDLYDVVVLGRTAGLLRAAFLKGHAKVAWK